MMDQYLYDEISSLKAIIARLLVGKLVLYRDNIYKVESSNYSEVVIADVKSLNDFIGNIKKKVNVSQVELIGD